MPVKKHNDMLARQFLLSTDTDGTINEVLYKKGLKKIHTESVTFTLMEQKPNKVLGTRAPPNNPLREDPL